MPKHEIMVGIALVIAILVAPKTVVTATADEFAASFADDREVRRSQARSKYQPVVLTTSPQPRQEFSLSGDWLFTPSTDPAAVGGALPATTDEKWHVLGVPQFWNEIEWWIYYKNRGTSHNFSRIEQERCSAFTFDYKNTKAGWYRQWIDLPKSAAGKRFLVQFDAVASAAEVFWNGEKIGTHVGMFSRFECEATAHIRPAERNLLAVYVAAIGHDPTASKEVAAIAVTMTVTKEMLQSMPHSTYPTSMAGIWQPPRLIVTGEQRLDDVYFRSTQDEALIETKVSGRGREGLSVRHTFFERDPAETQNTLPPRLADEAGINTWESKFATMDVASANTPLSCNVKISRLRPRLWSPEHPNLYWLKTELLANGMVVDEQVIAVGFRTFETREGKFFLNGKPYFLRGANMPPAGIQPNNAALADRFMRFTHDGNQMVTRFHMCPPPKVWMDAADRIGVGVSIEGSWPWVGIGKSEVPDDRLRKIWYDEMEQIARANRNHPSFLLLTLANESHFQAEHDPDLARKTRKYEFFSNLVKNMRSTAIGIPVVLHSGYIRPPEDFEKAVRPNNFDDGDVDDGHHYFGWYTQSPFRVDVQKDIESRSAYPDRPLISQEASTGYPDNDTGHAAESYIRGQRTPQIWVGRHGLLTARPDRFLETHALITKEMAEKVRRDRTILDGWGLFASTCWYRDVYDAERITPYPAYWAVQRAYEPVLVSLVTANRHYEAGQTFTSEVVVCNDDPDRPALRNLSLRWLMAGKSSDLGTSGTLPLPDCNYDARVKATTTFVVPERLPEARSELTLTLELRAEGEVVSRNEYTILAMAAAAPISGGAAIMVMEDDTATSSFFKRCGYSCQSVKSLDWRNVPKDSVVIVAQGTAVGDAEAFGTFLQRGTALLLSAGIKPGSFPMGSQQIKDPVLGLIPGFPKEPVKIVATSGDFADVLAPDLLDGLDPMDMHWWTAHPQDVVRVCRAAYQFPETDRVIGLVRHVQQHAYIQEADWPRFITWPVFEVPHEQGSVCVSSLLLSDDPVARKFYRNLLERLRKRASGLPLEYTIKVKD
jgi:beta-galactosidase